MFTELKLKYSYVSTKDDIPKVFYEPILKHAVSFDRVAAYFSAKALSLYAAGLEYFSNYGHKYRLIISKDISESDYEEIKKGYSLRESISAEMLESLHEELSLTEEQRISNLAYYIANGTVEIKIAFKKRGLFHDKSGVARDAADNIICFGGSSNETDSAFTTNYESFHVLCSYHDSPDHFYGNGIQAGIENFERLWNNKEEGLVVKSAPDVILNEILKFNKGKVIVDKVLLTSDSAILDYDGNNLILQINGHSPNDLVDLSFYRRVLRHRVGKIEADKFIFSRRLTYRDYLIVDRILSDKIPNLLGWNYYTTQRYRDYIEQRNLYIEERAKLGIQLKTDAEMLSDRYREFKDSVDELLVRKLRDKQMQDAFFMYSMMRSGNFSVPGSGKTSSALAVYAYLKLHNQVSRIVVVCPKNAFGSWMDEFYACFGNKEKLVLFNIQDSSLGTKENKKLHLKYDSGTCNMFLFNYESVGGYIDELKQIISTNTLLIFDEVHRVKAINGIYASYSLMISEKSRFTIAMTGTPIPNTYADLYNLLHILFNDEYEDFFGFHPQRMKDPTYSEIQDINEKIQPFFCRTSKVDLNVPKANPDGIIALDVSAEEQKLFEIVSSKYFTNKLALFIRLLQMETNPKLLLESIDLSEFSDILDMDFESGSIDIADYSGDVASLIQKIDLTTKKSACLELVKHLVCEKKTVIVWCIFKNSIKDICRRLNHMGVRAKYVMGEVALEDRLTLINAFRNGEFDVLVTNPHTLAESISLHTVCHDAVYYEYSYNLVHLLQSKDRIHRLGLPEGQYTQYYYLQNDYVWQGADYSFEGNVYSRLLQKENAMLDAIDNQELEPVYTTEEDLEKIFGPLE